MLFSQRHGLAEIKSVVQAGSMDDELRSRQWNAVSSSYWKKCTAVETHEVYPPARWLLTALWDDFFKKPIDTIPPVWSRALKEVRDFFFCCSWYEVYDFLEFVVERHYEETASTRKATASLIERCNRVLDEEMSGYRFVGKQVTPITAPVEIATVGSVIGGDPALREVHDRLHMALRHLSSRSAPDHRKTVEECLAAVDALCCVLTGDPSTTLDEGLAVLPANGPVPAALREAFRGLQDLRRGNDGPEPGLEEARLILVVTSAFVNYVTAETAKIGASGSDQEVDT